MKTSRLLLIVLLLLCTPLLSSRAYAVEYIDFGDANVFEEALNNGENVTNKIVSFEVTEIHPNFSLGFNLWSGQHLNFVSPSPVDVKPRDILTARITNVTNMLGSWFINYEIISDAVPGPDTRYYNAANDQLKPLEIIECGFSCSEQRSTCSTYYSFILYNPNDNKTIRFPTVRMVARNANGAMLGTEDKAMHQIDPHETVAFASYFPSLDVMPATIDFQVMDPQDYNIIKPTNVITDPMRAVNYTMTASKFNTKIVGEISNYTGYDFSTVGVVVLFRDVNGNLAGGETQYVSNVLSGGTTPFEVSIHSALTVFDRYEVRVIPWSEAKVSKGSANQSTQVTAATPATAAVAATPAVASASAAAVPSTPQSTTTSDSSMYGTRAPDQTEYSFGQGTFIVGTDLKPGTYDITCVSANMDSYNESMSSFAGLSEQYGLGDYSDYFGALGGLAESMNYVIVDIQNRNGYTENYLTIKPDETARIILNDGMKLEITNGSVKLVFVR